MRRLTSAVSVVSCVQGDSWFGMTATAITSVSADPAALLICINTSASIHGPLVTGVPFCVNILDVDQQAVSAAFSGQGKGRERFAKGVWQLGVQGIPYLHGAQANLFCNTRQIIPFGTHAIFIATVEDVRVADRVSPLLYENGRYTRSTEVA
jgi:flavin reductase